MPAGLFLGIDGGGSRTVALLADEQGRILGRGAGGPSNLQSVGLAGAQQALGEAIGGAYAAAALPRGPLAGACLGLAGAGRKPEREAWRQWLARQEVAGPRLVVADSDLVLAAGTPEGWGLALIAGTGSIAWGRDRAGELRRAGGWGYLLGDEGSGYAIGQAALRAVAQAADGRGPATTLSAVILGHWQLADPEALIGHLYGTPPVPPAEIAGLAPLVELNAEEGDAVAREIIWTAGEALAQALDVVGRRLGLGRGPLPCALGGGLLVRGRLVARRALEAAAEMGWELSPVARVEEPALGALRLARREIAVPYRG